uniref:Origin recognition complex subunit 5 n=1 Tax=Photinus pyralis TaxID=7054 RepID=A0A1Y1LEG7_PHOPY
MNSVQEELQATYPCRKKQIEELYNLFGYGEEPLVDAVYVYGSSSTGKTSIIKSLLRGLNLKFALVNLVECYTSKILFESILNQLSDHKIDVIKAQPYARCDNMMDFVANLRKCGETVDLSRAVIVLDKAERLRDMDSNLLPAFLRLTELADLSISVVFVSEIVFDNYCYKNEIVTPIKIHFSQYTKEEIIEILCLNFDTAREAIESSYGAELSITEEFYRNYLSVFLSVFHRACRDVSELKYMAKQSFVKYCQPVAKKDCELSDSLALWKHIAPVLKSSLGLLYMRISPTHQENSSTLSITAKDSQVQSLELPYYGKHLLIAAYLASYNPAKEDKRLYMKYHGKKARTKSDIRAKSKTAEQLFTQLGPKQFGFDRLIAIFYAILEEKVDLNSHLLVQISTLVELRLLAIVSDNSELDNRKYRCCVGLEYIEAVARNVGINIKKYLVDFN